MRKILIATPVKGGLSMEYVAQIISIFRSKTPDLYIDWRPCGGTSVALARNELAHVAMAEGFDELVFWDKDLGERSAQLQLNLFHRIISHPEPIVAAQYCGHGLPSMFHGCKFDDAAVPNAAGLLRMFQMPIGFCKISVEALKTIMRHTPERAYWNRELKGEAEHRHDFFPTGIMGPNTADGKLERIRLIANSPDDGWGYPNLHQVRDVIEDSDYSTNLMIGEDFMFCKLARDAGIPLHIDTHVIIPHETTVRLPLAAAELKSELSASWRMPEPAPSTKPPFSVIKEGEPLWPPDYLNPPLLCADHCREVLAGSYDIDFNPPKPPVILDIGANIGAFARWAAKRWPGCTPHCYEPHPDNFKLLERTWVIFDGINGFFHQAAVSDMDGTMELMHVGFNCGEYSLYGTSDMPSISVNVINAASLPKADILKIDTEGSEMAILQSLDRAGRLGEFSAIMLEFHAEAHLHLICDLLTKAGFKEVGRRIVSQHRGELKFLKA